MSKENKTDEPDIIDGYISAKKKLIIFISALSGTDLGKIGEILGSDLKIDVISERKYYKKDELEDIILSNGQKIKNIFNENVINWDEFNENISNLGGQNRGIIVTGVMFPTDKVVKPDLHIHLKISSEKLFEKRKQYISKHIDEFKLSEKDIAEYVKKVYEEVEVKFYKDIITKSFINKFIKVDDKDDEQIVTEIFNEIIHFIENVVNKIYN